MTQIPGMLGLQPHGTQMQGSPQFMKKTGEAPTKPDDEGKACKWEDPSFKHLSCPIKQLTFAFRSKGKTMYTRV